MTRGLAVAVAVVVSFCHSFGPVAEAANEQCGAIALAACLERLGCPVDALALAGRLPNAGEFASLSELAAAAREYRFAARGTKWPDQMPDGAPPAIVPIASFGDRLHFVAVLESRGSRMLVRDGDHEEWVFAAALRLAGWDGTALHIARNEDRLDAIVPGHWTGERLCNTAAAGLFFVSGLIVWHSRKWGWHS